MHLSINDVRFYMRNVRTRMPFKYGVATLTSVPILHVLMDIEMADGMRATGVAGDILPPKWFDKDPAKDYAENVDDLIAMARTAAAAYQIAGGRPRSLFDIWREGYGATLAAGDGCGLNHLTASHGSTLMERALFDGLGAALGLSYYELLQANLPGLDLGWIYSELNGVVAGDVIASEPLNSLYIRHTVGLTDPIWAREIAAPDRLGDGLPQALEEYIQIQALSYFKIKVSGDLEADLERLRSIAALLDQSASDYFITLDGNEQYRSIESFVELLDRVEEDRQLARFYASVLYIEQPLERSAALDVQLESGIRAVSGRKPMLIDESDGDLNTFKEATRLGYLGVSTKNCKGLIKALANQGLAQHLRATTGKGYFLTGEDLMNLPVVPLQQDLTHVAALGILHVERNGHHYVHGLDHLALAERQGCRQQHASLYGCQGNSLVLKIGSGAIDVSSLQVPGLGARVDVDVESMVPLEEWEFASLA